VKFFFVIFSLVFFFFIPFYSLLAQEKSISEVDKKVIDFVSKLPYKVNFTPEELSAIKKLSQENLNKIIDIAKKVYKETKESEANRRKSEGQSILPNLLTFPPSQQPLLQPTQNALPLSRQQGGQPQGQSNQFLPGTNQDALSKYFGPQSLPGQFSPGQPLNTNLEDNKIRESFPETKPGGKCEDFGAVNSMGGASAGGIAALSPKLKMDLSNLCRLTGKRLVITSGYRPNDNRYHGRRFAIDTALSPYSQEEQVIVVLYFMAHFYGGIGSYGNQPMHLDHRDHSMR
jgi:hypothetical protein